MGVRVDKWLWSVRIFKSRSLATEACKSSKVSIGGKAVKPSREINIGECIDVRKEAIHLHLKVLQLSEKRMGAALVKDFMLDQTPQEEYDKLRTVKSRNYEYREHGLGRPTKKDRRNLTHFKDYL